MSFRIVPVLDKDPQILASCSKPLGRWTLLICFVGFLPLFTDQWPWIAVCLTLTNAFPLHRRGIISLLGALFAITRPMWLVFGQIQLVSAQEGLTHLPERIVPATVLGVFLLLGALASLAFRFPTNWLTRRPVAVAVLALSALVIAVTVAPLHGAGRVVAWIAILALARMLWFFCYTLSDRNSRDRDGIPLQAGLWRPVWMLGDVSGVPIAKGAAYLRRIEARNSEELAVTQCKAMKLLLWAFVLKLGLILFHFLIIKNWAYPTIIRVRTEQCGRSFFLVFELAKSYCRIPCHPPQSKRCGASNYRLCSHGRVPRAAQHVPAFGVPYGR